ncbi:hypothetical protein ACFE04_028129 [Oxalis oulophora]
MASLQQQTSLVIILMMMMMITFFHISSVRATVYFVGGPNGWTPMFDTNGLTLDYTEWQSPRTFQVGDTLVFHYRPNEDNLIQVTHQDFERCNLDSPINLYISGYTKIILDKVGHYYFLCGYHCSQEQKLEIIVNPSPFPTTAPPPLSMPPTSQSNLPTSTAVNKYSSIFISIFIMALAYVFLY